MCHTRSMTQDAQAPTTGEWMKGYDQHLAEQAQALLASLPKRRIRKAK